MMVTDVVTLQQVGLSSLQLGWLDDCLGKVRAMGPNEVLGFVRDEIFCLGDASCLELAEVYAEKAKGYRERLLHDPVELVYLAQHLREAMADPGEDPLSTTKHMLALAEWVRESILDPDGYQSAMPSFDETDRQIIEAFREAFC